MRTVHDIWDDAPYGFRLYQPVLTNHIVTDLRFLYANALGAASTAQAPAALEGRLLSKVVPTDTVVRRLTVELTALVHTGKPFSYVRTFVGMDSHEYSYMGSTWRTNQGEIALSMRDLTTAQPAVANLQDVTDRLRGAVAESEAVLNAWAAQFSRPT